MVWVITQIRSRAKEAFTTNVAVVAFGADDGCQMYSNAAVSTLMPIIVCAHIATPPYGITAQRIENTIKVEGRKKSILFFIQNLARSLDALSFGVIISIVLAKIFAVVIFPVVDSASGGIYIVQSNT